MLECQSDAEHIDVPLLSASANLIPLPTQSEESDHQVHESDEELLHLFAKWRLQSEEDEKSTDRQPPIKSDCAKANSFVKAKRTKLLHPPCNIRPRRTKTNPNPIDQKTAAVRQRLSRHSKSKPATNRRGPNRKSPPSKRPIRKRWLKCDTCDYKSHRLDFFNIHTEKFHCDEDNKGPYSDEEGAPLPKRFKPINDDDLIRQLVPDHRQNAVVVLSSALTSAIQQLSVEQSNNEVIAPANPNQIYLEKMLMQLCSRSFLSPTAFNQFNDLVVNEEVNVNYVDSEGLTPLLRLCLHHKRQTLFGCVQLMLLKRKDVDVNWRHGANQLEGTDGCFNALAMLARHYQGSNLYEIAHLLLQHGVRPDVIDINGDHTLIVLCANYKDERLLHVVRLFLDTQQLREMINATNSKGWSALFVLCYNYKGDNLLKIVQLLIDNGASVKCKDKSGWDCLLALAVEQHGHKDFVEIVRLLVSKGADINSIDNRESFGILHILCANYKGDQLVHLIQILLFESECEADLDIASTAKKSRGWTLIHFLCGNQKQTQHFCTILSLFVQNGFQLNSRDEDGRSFSHFLCNGKLDVDRAQVILNILSQVAKSDLALDASAEDNRHMKPVDYLKKQKKMDAKIKAKLIELFDVIAASKKMETTAVTSVPPDNIELEQSPTAITSPIPTAEPITLLQTESVTLVAFTETIDLEPPSSSVQHLSIRSLETASPVIHVNLQSTPTPTPSPTHPNRLCPLPSPPPSTTIEAVSTMKEPILNLSPLSSSSASPLLASSSSLASPTSVLPSLVIRDHRNQQRKIHKCDFEGCEKVYARKDKLQVHKRIHTGEKPFECTWEGCTWKFRAIDSLNRHLQKHGGKKPFLCQLCPRSFSQSDQLLQHTKYQCRF